MKNNQPIEAHYPRHADPFETNVRSGRRFVPVRMRDGQTYLNTHWVTDTPEEAVMGARMADIREMGPDWAADNALVGVAEISFEILNLHSLESLGLANVQERRPRR